MSSDFYIARLVLVEQQGLCKVLLLPVVTQAISAISVVNLFPIRFPKFRLKRTGIFTLWASRSGRICFVAKGSQP